MPDYMKEMQLEEKDLIVPTAPQVMVCLCVDSSYSMIQEGRMNKVNQGIQQFIDDCLENDYVKDSIDLCIVSFGKTKPEVLQHFDNVSKVHFTPIKPSGGTPLGKAIQLCLDEINKRVEYFNQVGTPLYKPWLIIMSDDESDDDISDVARKIQQMIRNGDLKTKCIDISMKSKKLSGLKLLSGDGTVDSLDQSGILDFFGLLSRKAAGLSMATAEEDTGLSI